MGTSTDSSYMFMGKVPFPLPMTPCCPTHMPLSPVKITSVFSRRCSSSKASSSWPTPLSMPYSAAQ